MGIGGSVTEGHSWAAMSAEWLQKQYPDNAVLYVDGAYGGTPPWQSVFRMRRDIVPYHPDLIFIEYSVNSYPPQERCWQAEDGLIRQLLAQPQHPEIVFVYVGNDKGERDLSAVQPVARHYGFPEVDVRAHMQKKIDAGEVKWTDLARDAIHPNEKGHAIYAEEVISFLQQQAAAAKNPAPPAPPLPAPYFSDALTTADLLPIGAAKASPEWTVIAAPGWTGKFLDEMYQTDQPGATLSLTARTTVLGVYLIQTTDSGQLEYRIDGGEPKVQNLWMPWLSKDGLFVRNFLFAENLPEGEHTLTLKVLPKSEKSEGNFVRIGGFCVTNPRPKG